MFHCVELGEPDRSPGINSIGWMPLSENGGYFVLRPEIFDHLLENGNLVEDACGSLAKEGKLMRNNTMRNNTRVKGKKFADRKANFPVGTIYLSEAGGEPRVPARTDKIEIYGNNLENNWSGITAWENADRYCNSTSNTSTGYCTRLVSSPTTCSAPGINNSPLYDDCRWKTQRLDIHDNVFTYDVDRAEWQAEPYRQDAGSTFSDNRPERRC